MGHPLLWQCTRMGGGGRALRDTPPCLAVKTASRGWATRVLGKGRDTLAGPLGWVSVGFVGGFFEF
jgi:hypothetical protein